VDGCRERTTRVEVGDNTAHPGVGVVRFTRPADGPLNDRGWCTGTLIADRAVLTAAHCVFSPSETHEDFFVTFDRRLLSNPLVDPSVAGEYLAGTAYADPRFDYREQGTTKSQDRAVILLVIEDVGPEEINRRYGVPALSLAGERIVLATNTDQTGGTR